MVEAKGVIQKRGFLKNKPFGVDPKVTLAMNDYIETTQRFLLYALIPVYLSWK